MKRVCSVCRASSDERALVPEAWHARERPGERFCQRCFATDWPAERILTFGATLNKRFPALLSKWEAEQFMPYVLLPPGRESAVAYVLESQLDAHHRTLMRAALPADYPEAALERMVVDYRTQDVLYEAGARAFAEEMAAFYALPLH